MTNQQYQDELAWIRDMVSISRQEAGLCYRNYVGLKPGPDRAVWVRMQMCAFKRLDIVTSYRAKLVRWFWTSRVGNPPTP